MCPATMMRLVRSRSLRRLGGRVMTTCPPGCSSGRQQTRALARVPNESGSGGLVCAREGA